MVARQPAVDQADHPIPVVKQVDGNHRRHDDEGKNIDNGEAAAPYRADDAGRPAGPLVEHVADRRADRFRVHAEACRPSAFEDRLDEAVHLHDVRRQIGDQQRQLVDQNRQHQEEKRDDHQERQDHDRQRRGQPAEFATLEPMGHGIEQIGHRHAADERQQDRAEHLQEDHHRHQRGHPEDDLAINLHLGSLPLMAASSCAGEPMWRTQSTA